MLLSFNRVSSYDMESLTRPTSSFSTDRNRGDVKDAMKKYWLKHSHEADMTKMLMDSGATEISREELPEVLSLLPSIKGKKVLELAGGIGRFTGRIAQQASHVTAVDFMEPFIEESKKNNNNCTNIDYVVDDVMNLEFENESFDLIFSNWFLMYFCEDDLHKLARKLLMWLKDGGFFFFRESCVTHSGNIRRDFNPTLYRFPECYNNYFQSVSVISGGQTRWGFDLRFTSNLQSYMKFKGNRNQICWLLQKKRLNDDIHDCDYKHFLRNKQNSKRDILRYEKIFGDGFINIGGLEMVQEYGAEVLGVDMSSLLIEIAWEKKYKTDKDAHGWLKAGGKIVISDFCLKERPDKEHSSDSLKKDDCKMYTFKAYREMIEAAGFVEVKPVDRSKQMVDFINNAKTKITKNIDEYLVDFTKEELSTMVATWNNELKRYEAKDQIWCLFFAQKPMIGRC